MSGAPIPIRRQRYDGSDYVPELDNVRLDSQIGRIWALMLDGRWRTLDEIARRTGDPHASISAQLRHLRKPRFGEHTVEKRSRGDRRRGLFEYRLEVNQPEPQQASLFEGRE